MSQELRAGRSRLPYRFGSDMFNPYSKSAIRRSFCYEMARQPLIPLGGVNGVIGAGIYAIYYHGTDPLYAGLSQRNNPSAPPIYVGRAKPAGARTGGLEDDASEHGRTLGDRLRNHATSISVAENLSLDDFSVRYCVVDHEHIEQGEEGLIRLYRPVWNHVLYGFGNRDVGGTRTAQDRSRWDTVHPGRPRVHLLKCNELSAQQLRDMVRDHISGACQTHSEVERRLDAA
jgi:hypothetical protein